MDVMKELLVDYSKSNTIRVAGMIGPNQESFDQLMMLFLSDAPVPASRAAWVARYCFDAYPWLVKPHISKMIRHLEKEIQNGVKRCIVYILQHCTIPEALEGRITETCYVLLNNAKEPVANKIFAMGILYNMIKKYPELEIELEETIRSQMPYSSPGFKSRGDKILKKLKKGKLR